MAMNSSSLGLNLVKYNGTCNNCNRQINDGFFVQVNIFNNGSIRCSCPDYQRRQPEYCKHVFACLDYCEHFGIVEDTREYYM